MSTVNALLFFNALDSPTPNGYSPATKRDLPRQTARDNTAMKDLNVEHERTDPVVDSLATRHGPLLGGTALWHVLGYASARAFSKAVERNTVPVTTFHIPHRRGRFAMTHDVIAWLRATSAITCRKQNT